MVVGGREKAEEGMEEEEEPGLESGLWRQDRIPGLRSRGGEPGAGMGPAPGFHLNHGWKPSSQVLPGSSCCKIQSKFLRSNQPCLLLEDHVPRPQAGLPPVPFGPLLGGSVPPHPLRDLVNRSPCKGTIHRAAPRTPSSSRPLPNPGPCTQARDHLGPLAPGVLRHFNPHSKIYFPWSMPGSLQTRCLQGQQLSCPPRHRVSGWLPASAARDVAAPSAGTTTSSPSPSSTHGHTAQGDVPRTELIILLPA